MKRADRELGREALRDGVQRAQRAPGLVKAAAGHELAEGPQHPAGQALRARGRHTLVAGGRGEHRFDQRGGGVEVGRQRGLQRVGDLHRARFHFQRLEPAGRQLLEALVVEVRPVPGKQAGGIAHQPAVDQVLERLRHGWPPARYSVTGRLRRPRKRRRRSRCAAPRRAMRG
jgi:hypothetical protein